MNEEWELNEIWPPKGVMVNELECQGMREVLSMMNLVGAYGDRMEVLMVE